MENINFLDLFSGGGGLSKGFSDINYFNDVGFVEKWEPAIKTYKSNFKKSKLIGKDITKLSKEKLLKKLNKEDIDLIIGGPPCQGFSVAGKRDPNDPRNSLFMDYLRIVNLIQPKIFLIENVNGLKTMKTKKGKKVIEVIKEESNKKGYNIKYKILDAADYGVPQHRKRIFIVGLKKGFRFKFPNKTHGDQNDLLDNKKPYNTVRKAISDLKPLKSGEKSDDPLHFAVNHVDRHIKWLSVTPEGKSAHENDDPNYQPPSGFKTTYKRIWWDRPSPTVTTCFSSISSQNNVHPRDTRAITIREAARLQTFPDDYQFKGSITSIRKQIGNAVPPLLAKKLAESILNSFLENETNISKTN